MQKSPGEILSDKDMHTFSYRALTTFKLEREVTSLSGSSQGEVGDKLIAINRNIGSRSLGSKKKISKLRFAQSSFGQKVRSTFPIAQCQVASPLQYGASNIVVWY